MKTSPWTDVEDIKLTEAVGMYDGMGRGGTVDWSKVCQKVLIPSDSFVGE
jgi:hypothetical protein